MQNNMITGNLTADVDYNPQKQYARFTLADDTYVGKDEHGKPKIETVYIEFTAFKQRAKAIAENTQKGDQLIVAYEIRNNNYVTDTGEKRYGYNFYITDFKFGSRRR